jgi:GntR family transcriptional regulator/MocR family aminotransferase
MAYDYLQLDRDSSVPLYRQLYLCIRRAVESGSLREGNRLPSVRRLASALALSCTTVETAFQQLCVEGYLRAEPKRGYFVRGAMCGEPERAPAPAALPHAPEPPVKYDFGSDRVSIGETDIKIWRRNVREVLNRQNVLVSYGDPQGEPALREALSAYSYRVRGVAAKPEQIVIGAGTQPLLSLLCGLLGREPVSVAMEEPGFPQAEQVFAEFGLPVCILPGDDDGICMDALEQSGARLAYVSPSNRVRTGSCIPMSRRVELLNWASRTGGILIEDDYNGELRYRARPVPAMQGIAAGCGVVYVGSFSKLLLPSVRIGYMVLTPELLARYLPRAANSNQTSSKVEQLALAEYIRTGQMEKHLRRLRKLYGAKSEALLRALREAFGSRAEILLQETPLTVLLSLPTEMTAGELCRLALENGVRVRPADGGRVRLGFAGIPLGEIDEAVACLKGAWSGII